MVQPVTSMVNLIKWPVSVYDYRNQSTDDKSNCPVREKKTNTAQRFVGAVKGNT